MIISRLNNFKWIDFKQLPIRLRIDDKAIKYGDIGKHLLPLLIFHRKKYLEKGFGHLHLILAEQIISWLFLRWN